MNFWKPQMRKWRATNSK